jgi:GT2 family glycosyltransferase
MTVSVVIPTVRPHTVAAAVASIRRQTHADLEIVVVAQGHDPALRAVTDDLAKSDSRVKIVWLDQGNLSAARNAGVAASRGEILAFTDDDCEADPRWVELMLQVFAERPQVGFVGGEVIAPPSQRLTISTCPSAQVMDAYYQPSLSGYEAPAGFYLIGANMGLRRSVFDAIGPFDPGLGAGSPYPACEDTDYVLRAELADVGFVTSPHLVVRHTYGRRYGVRSFLKHHANYARGRGAILVKLQWMNHRLAKTWGATQTPFDRLKGFVKHPAKWLLMDLYGAYYQRQAAVSFAQEFELSNQGICVPRDPH